ncbi:hypothetical protein QG37_04079 [Candidozyma auris]|nr:hypothetical protein QG37_04079 [[Candida] auris]
MALFKCSEGSGGDKKKERQGSVVEKSARPAKPAKPARPARPAKQRSSRGHGLGKCGDFKVVLVDEKFTGKQSFSSATSTTCDR